MHENLVKELLQFAKRNNLRLDYKVDVERYVYVFRFRDQKRTWGFVQEWSIEQLDQFSGDTVFFAYETIENLKRTIPNLY